MSDQTELKISESMAEQIKTVVGKAQKETSKLVDSLIKESEKIRDQTLKLAEEKAGEVSERVEEVRGMVAGARTRAAGALDNLEQLFEERVSRALKRLGVPTRDDLQSIASRLEKLDDLLKTLAIDQRAPSTTTTRPGKQDDLKLIVGIGPVLESKLNAAGICSYRQLAALTDSDIDHLESEVIHFGGRIRREDWIGQAKALYSKKYDEQL
ncbi:MAG TPA: phasin family protein [Candidatus Competibacter sp.]|nr:phasin family protein [Candidatus Competibacter sp.]